MSKRACLVTRNLLFFTRLRELSRDGWRIYRSDLQASSILFISYMITKALILQRCSDLMIKHAEKNQPHTCTPSDTMHLYCHNMQNVFTSFFFFCLFFFNKQFFILFVKCAHTYEELSAACRANRVFLRQWSNCLFLLNRCMCTHIAHMLQEKGGGIRGSLDALFKEGICSAAAAAAAALK